MQKKKKKIKLHKNRNIIKNKHHKKHNPKRNILNKISYIKFIYFLIKGELITKNRANL